MPGYVEFIQNYPAYDHTHDLDELREREYSRLDRLGQVYLDYTGEACMPSRRSACTRNCWRAMSLGIHTPAIPPRWLPPA